MLKLVAAILTEILFTLAPPSWPPNRFQTVPRLVAPYKQLRVKQDGVPSTLPRMKNID